MAFYDYVILDGYRYKTPSRQWKPITLRPASGRLTLQGNFEGTFGPGTVMRWEGAIACRYGETAPGDADGTLDGNIVTLRATLAKNEMVSFTDHNGIAHTVVVLGPFEESTLHNMWDAPSNKYYVRVTITGK